MFPLHHTCPKTVISDIQYHCYLRLASLTPPSLSFSISVTAIPVFPHLFLRASPSSYLPLYFFIPIILHLWCHNFYSPKSLMQSSSYHTTFSCTLLHRLSPWSCIYSVSPIFLFLSSLRVEIKYKVMTPWLLNPEVVNHISYLYWIYSILHNICR